VTVIVLTSGRLLGCAVKWEILLRVFPLPLALLAAGAALASWPVLAMAFALQYLGLLAARWFFFAPGQAPAEPVLPGDFLSIAPACCNTPGFCYIYLSKQFESHFPA